MMQENLFWSVYHNTVSEFPVIHISDNLRLYFQLSERMEAYNYKTTQMLTPIWDYRLHNTLKRVFSIESC